MLISVTEVHLGFPTLLVDTIATLFPHKGDYVTTHLKLERTVVDCGNASWFMTLWLKCKLQGCFLS